VGKNPWTHRTAGPGAGNPPKGDLRRCDAQPPSEGAGTLAFVLIEELRRLADWSERHRRLVSRLLLALGLTMLVDAIGTVLVWAFESGVKGGDIHGLGDAFFFSTVQLLTVSSQIKNPLTTGGRIVDVGLELWALFVVTAFAGSFAAFFATADQ
jgi:hypothetical protein